MDIVALQQIGVYAEVKRQVRQVPVVYTAAEDAHVIVLVVERYVVQQDVIGDQSHGVASQRVGGAQRLDGSLAVNDEQSLKLHGGEGTVQFHLSVGMSADVVEERFGERVQEVDVCTASLDVEVDVVALWRHIAIDDGLCIGAVVGNGVDVDLFQLVVPVDGSSECTHTSVLKGELVDAEVGMHRRCA